MDFEILGGAGKLKQAATISLKTSSAVRLKETVEASIHTARLDGLNRMKQLKDFAKGRAIAVGKKLERDIIDAVKGIDKGVIAAKQLKESVFPKHQFATPDGAIVSGSKVENTHAVENFFRAKIEDVKGSKGTGNTVSDYIDEIIVNGKVDADKMNKLKNAIQNNTFSVDELAEISKKMSELGITKEYDEALIKIDFGKYLRGLIGDPPTATIDPHAHHILFKKGLGQKQQELVREGQEILKKYGIEPIIGKENLVWAPNRIAGQHGIERLQHIVDKLKAADSFGGTREKMIDMLRLLGEEAESMK
ncbi:AHH domain-containing protein [Pseudogracilibacillus sp. SE30717A]|uniref:hypothetical protein n=1 Tax=Pseudogracilibacillus sp. SE30717A TaxID=3098293 RepID=UPI00300DCCC5